MNVPVPVVAKMGPKSLRTPSTAVSRSLTSVRALRTKYRPLRSRDALSFSRDHSHDFGERGLM